MPIHIIPILPMQMLNAYLVEQEKGLILFDCGLPQSPLRIGKALARIGRSWDDLSLIILSHGHVDHAGGAAGVQAFAPKARLLAGWAEADYLSGRKAFQLFPTGVTGRGLFRAGLIQRAYPEPRVDHWVKDQTDLADFGFEGKLLATPGHTPGSIAALLPDGQVLAGDLLASGLLMGGIALRHRPKRPPFEEQPKAAAQSLQRLLDMGGTAFHPGHGGAVAARDVARHIRRLQSL